MTRVYKKKVNLKQWKVFRRLIRISCQSESHQGISLIWKCVWNIATGTSPREFERKRSGKYNLDSTRMPVAMASSKKYKCIIHISYLQWWASSIRGKKECQSQTSREIPSFLLSAFKTVPIGVKVKRKRMNRRN